jgi:hypothetical protein
MNVSSPTKKVVFTLAFMVLIVGAGLYGLFWMIQKNINRTNEVEGMIEERTASEESAKELKELVGDLTPDIDKLSSRALPINGDAGFIETVEARARGLDLSIEIASAQERDVQGTTAYKYLDLTMRTQGGWAATNRFISLIENLPYKTLVTAVTIHGQPIMKTASSTAVTSQWTGTFTFMVLKHK